MKTMIVEKTTNKSIPAVVRKGSYSTSVWIQSEWTDGEYAYYIRKNGCGHCCTAMAACLYGVDTDPYREYMLCRELWGPPCEESGQDHFITVAGIVKILRFLGVPATCYGVKEPRKAINHIMQSLKEDKLVIFVSDPFLNAHNPFSTGYHYVLACGLNEDGTILIANSSEKVTKGGIQNVLPHVVKAALYRNSTADMSMTWGVTAELDKGCTYVVVG